MPRRLRPKAALAPAAVLVGDPGRSLLLAQRLLREPKMSNHARGLWGYTGVTAAGEELTLQATGMGGPSAALVLDDLAKLGVRRAVRIGTCTGFDAELGELLLVDEAVAAGGSAASFGVAAGETAAPDPELTDRLAAALVDARRARVASLDALPATAEAVTRLGAGAADMQTLALFARGRAVGIAVAAALIVSEAADGSTLDEEVVERAAVRAGEAAAIALANPQVEG
jgi:uridine phosphorylase